MAIDYQPLFILAGGMLLQERKLSVIANNIANVDTPSFKKDLVEVSSWYTDMGEKTPSQSPFRPDNNFVYPIIQNIYTDISQGSIKETGNPLDLAIQGEAFFAVRTPEGIRYTKKGNFSLDSKAYLVTEEGFRVLDRNGREIRILGNTIDIDEEGNIYIDGNLSYTLGIWALENPTKVGEDFFVGTAQPTQEAVVLQGFLELSNVNAVVEMVRLIEASRAHEVYSRLIQAMDEVQSRVNTITR